LRGERPAKQKDAVQLADRTEAYLPRMARLSVQPARAYLPIRGSQIFYETSGSGEPLLLLHGGFGTVDDFASQTPEFARHFKVVAFERPGHGHTADTEGPFTFATMAEYTAELIEALDLGASNILGWSDGAIVSLLLAISRPDLVKRLVSVSGLFNTDSLNPRTLAWIKSSTPESFRKDAAALVKRYDEVSPDGAAHFPVVFEKTKRLWLNEPDISHGDLARIVAPTLILAGDRDDITAEHTLELFRSIKGAQLCVVPGTTHFLLSERPVATNRAILDFLLAEGKPKN
jgi:pimeloyl-ACP methyl ester carboxylesterase